MRYVRDAYAASADVAFVSDADFVFGTATADRVGMENPSCRRG